MSFSQPTWIALGGNIGDVADYFRQTREHLQQHPACSCVQSALLYQTPPIGPEGQDDYLNTMLFMHTTLAPIALLNLLQSIELQHGRVRQVHWGARTLDLDIIAYGDVIMQHERLTLPHSYMHQRQFVLRPMCDLSPTWMHPIQQHTAKQLLSQRIKHGEQALPQGINW